MCIICADMSGQFRRSDFLPEDLAVDRGLSASMRANGGNPLAFLDLDERGGSGPNGKASFGPVDAGAQITRTNLSWAPGLGQAATVTYSYRSNAPTPMPSDTSGFTRFTQTQIEATELMLLAWSDVARITFQRDGAGTSGEGAYSDNATMIFGNYSAGASGAAAFAYLPGSTSAASNAGNVWVNSSLSYNSAPTYLAYGYQVLLHEIGHAIGLSHPADYNAGPGVSITYSAHAIYYEDSRQYTVMSYFSESNTGGSFFGRYSSAPLLDDIAAAQRLYGANMTTRTGDTVYGFNSTADRIWFDATQGGGNQDVIFAVWDAGGIDTLDFSGYSQNGLIDLRQGHFSSVGRMTGNVSIAMGAVIENATGGGGNDTIIGNSADNRLRGLTGNDTLDGGAGSDTAVYAGPQANYTVTAGTEVVNGVSYRIVTVTGSEGTDVLRNIEFLAFSDGTIAAPTAAAGVILEGDATADNITGTAFADWIYGADGADTINGGDGDDRVNGGRGNDNLNGGNGNDTVDYAGSNAGVTVNLTTGTATGGGGTDTLSNFENIGGTTRNDTLTGNGLANVINGAGGVDVLNGEGGNDTLIAGAGTLVGAEDVVKPSSQANLSIGTSVNIDGNFDLIDDAGVLNATTIPHAVIRGTSSGGGQEYYAVTVTAGQVCTFDIASATFDTTLRIFDAGGNQLAVNDDDDGSTNSFINHTFASSGTYYIAVGAYSSGSGASVVSGPPPFGAQYVLNVSVPGHPVVEAVGVGSTLNGGEGDDLLQGGISDDDINGGNGTDTAVFAGNRSAWTITDNGGGNFTISNGSQTDTLTGVEFAQFADQTVSLGGAPVGPTPGDDTLAGTSGDDVIDGLAGNDSIDGLAGNDVLTGGLGADTLTGGLGNDRFVFGSDTQSSLASPDTITDFTSGSDTIDLAAAAQSGIAIARLGGQSFVYFSPSAGSYNGLVQVVGTVQGSDILTGGIGVTMFGDDSAADLLIGTAAVDVILGGGGGDTLRGAGGADVLTGGAGADVFSFEAGDSTTSAYDTITDFTSASDIISLGGPAGSVFLSRLGDSTFVYYGLSGGAYQNVISVTGAVQGFDITASSVIMYGDAAANVLTGHTGADTIVGGGGNDTLRGVGGADVLYGGEGSDTFAYGGASDSTMSAYDVIADFTTGADRINLTTLVGAGYSNVALARFGGSTFIYFGLAGAAQFDGVIQAVGDVNGLDLITGGSSLNLTFYGSSGGDDLRGGAGADTVLAGAGTDYILGGAGGDSLFGGSGADLFAYTAASHSTATVWDTIQDFEVGVDRIDLRGVASSVLLSTFGGNTFVYFNPNGSGGYDGLIIVAGVTLTQDDVLVTGESASVLGGEKDGGLTLPGLIDDDPWVLPADFSGKGADSLTHPLLDDPLVLPPGYDDKATPDEAPVVCLPTDVAVESALGDSSGSDRGLHWSDYQPRTLDWIY